MDFSVQLPVYPYPRPHSSGSSYIKSASFHTKNLLIRDNYTQKMLKQRQNDLQLQHKHHQAILKRSEKRFSHSPFAINIIAESELQEHERSLAHHSKKSKSLSKAVKSPNKTQKYLSRLRSEIRQKGKGNFSIEELKIHCQLILKKSEEKQKKAKKNRKLYIQETLNLYKKPFYVPLI